jgi:hypothetical protein
MAYCRPSGGPPGVAFVLPDFKAKGRTREKEASHWGDASYAVGSAGPQNERASLGAL